MINKEQGHFSSFRRMRNARFLYKNERYEYDLADVFRFVKSHSTSTIFIHFFLIQFLFEFKISKTQRNSYKEISNSKCLRFTETSIVLWKKFFIFFCN